MWKKMLLALLVISAVSEAFMGIAGFAAPAWMMTQFHVAVTPDTLFLAFVLAWMLCLIAALCVVATRDVMAGRRSGWQLSIVLGFWWIGIGFGIFLGFGRFENLVLDSAKGGLLVLAAFLSRET